MCRFLKPEYIYKSDEAGTFLSEDEWEWVNHVSKDAGS